MSVAGGGRRCSARTRKLSRGRQSSGGHVVVEQLLELGADLAFGVPGESYLAVLDGLYDISDEFPFRRHPARRRSRDDGRRPRSAHRPARHRDGDPGAGRHQRQHRRTRRQPGRQPDAAVRRPGAHDQARSPARSRRSTTARCSGRWRRTSSSSTRRPDPRARRPAYVSPRPASPVPSWSRLPEDVLFDLDRLCSAARASSPRSSAVANDVEQILDALDRLVVHWSSSPATRGRPMAAPAPHVRGELACRSPPRPVARTSSTTAAMSSSGLSGSRPPRASRGSPAEADVVLLLGGPPDGLTAEDGDWLTRLPPGRPLLHVYPIPTSWTASTLPTWRSAARPDFAARHWRRSVAASPLPAARSGPTGVDGCGQHRVAGRSRGRWRLHPEAFMAALAEQVAPDAVADCRGGCLHRLAPAPPRLHPVSLAAGQPVREHGLRPARRDRGRIRRSAREVVAFAGDGCFSMTGQELSTAARYGLESPWSWSTTACTARSGAIRSTVPRTAERHRLGEPGFRRAGACSRRLGGDRADTRRVRRSAGCPAGRRGVPGGGGPTGPVVDAAAGHCSSSGRHRRRQFVALPGHT